MNKELSVRLYGKPAGILRKNKNGKLEFIYGNDAPCVAGTEILFKIFDEFFVIVPGETADVQQPFLRYGKFL